MNTKKTNRRVYSNVLHGFLMLGVLLTANSVAQAQSSFNIDFNANVGILANDGSAGSLMNAAWNTQLSLLLDFNSVALRIYNDASSTDNITEFAFTIGDERFNFANFTQTNELLLPSSIVMSSAAAVTSNPHIMSTDQITAIATTNQINPQTVAAGADGADRLVVSFGDGGIAPGYSALFEVRFEFDDSIPLADRPNNEPLLAINNSVIAQMFPSYQRILFDTDGASPAFYSDDVDLDDLSDNAAATVTFDSGLVSEPIFLSDVIGLASTGFVDARHPNPRFITPNLNGQAIPEPTALVLLLTGFAGIAARRRRSC